MGYYCTVPQCTSLAGKTKNVKFHRFPRNTALAARWNTVLHRNKPITNYSKVCSLHFTQADYNVTNLGQWKTLSKDAMPTQNLPKLNPDGTVMVIRKSRTVKYKPEGEGGDATAKRASRTGSGKRASRDDSGSEKRDWNNTTVSSFSGSPARSSVNTSLETSDNDIQQRINTLNALANNISPQLKSLLEQPQRPVKLDATMQTDPLDTSLSNDSQDSPEPLHEKENKRASADDYRFVEVYTHEKVDDPKNQSKDSDGYDKEYAKNDDLNKAAESYALERNSKRGRPYEVKSAVCYKQSYDVPVDYKQQEAYCRPQELFSKSPEAYSKPPEPYEKSPESFNRPPDAYGNGDYNRSDASSNESYHSRDGYAEAFTKEVSYVKEQYAAGFAQNSADVLRNHQHNLQMLQQQLSARMAEEASFYGGRIKEELDLNNDEEKFLSYEAQGQKEAGYGLGCGAGDEALVAQQQRQQHLMQQPRPLDVYERPTIKSEPDLHQGCETPMQPQLSPLPVQYYRSDQHGDSLPTSVAAAYYSRQREKEALAQQQAALAHQQQHQFTQPGAELLIAKQNALAAHTTLWHNTAKRPFSYGESSQLNSQVHPRYEDVTRLLN